MNPKQTSRANRPTVAVPNSTHWANQRSLMPKPAASQAFTTPSSPGKSTLANAGTLAAHQAKETKSPIHAVLSPNVTPRSGARKARVDSTSSTPKRTPHGTPQTSRPTSMIYDQEHDAFGITDLSSSGLKELSSGRKVRSQSLTNDSTGSARSSRPRVPERNIRSGKTTSSAGTPLFFRADDIRPGLASIPSERFVEAGKQGFSRASRIDDNDSIGSFESISPTFCDQRPKFFYLNGAAEPGVPSRHTVELKAKQAVLTSNFTGPNSSPVLRPQRAPSPLKNESVSRRSSLSQAAPRRHTRLVSNEAAAHKQEIRMPEALSTGLPVRSRRSSLNAPEKLGFRRSESNNIADVDSKTRRLSLASSVCSTSLSIGAQSTIDKIPSKDVCSSPPTVLDASHPVVPVHLTGNQSKLEQMNELAANARRERKVLDLEISNSSLLVINRTLERQMRKQNAELRRFRRLGQTGRLSIAPSLRSASKTLSMWSESNNPSGQSTPSFSLEDDEDSDDDEISSLSPSSETSSPNLNPFSPSHAARLRANDTKQLQLHFTRHREMLINSQKLNQSLQRCLDLAGDLIADGKKALEYHVHVATDENRPGRVLLPDELGDDIEVSRQGLLSPGCDGDSRMLWEEREHTNEEVHGEASCEVSHDVQHAPIYDSGKQTQDLEQDISNAEGEDGWDGVKNAEVAFPGGATHRVKEYFASLSQTWGI